MRALKVSRLHGGEYVEHLTCRLWSGVSSKRSPDIRGRFSMMRIPPFLCATVIACAFVAVSVGRSPAKAAGTAAAITFAPPIEYFLQGDHVIKADWDADGHLDLATVTREGLALFWGHG